jgi:hypothetical protein
MVTSSSSCSRMLLELVWAEMNLFLADEFRDGNVPATYRGLAAAKAAYAALPFMVKELYYRGDSARHEH